MVHFIGYVEGGRGEASRLGHKSTGLTTRACSWQGAVAVHLYAKDGVDYARVELAKHRGAGVDVTLYDGPIGELSREGLLRNGARSVFADGLPR